MVTCPPPEVGSPAGSAGPYLTSTSMHIYETPLVCLAFAGACYLPLHEVVLPFRHAANDWQAYKSVIIYSWSIIHLQLDTVTGGRFRLSRTAWPGWIS